MVDTLGPAGYAAGRVEGAALSRAEAVAYASRGRGRRNRPKHGWSSLTPTEREVVLLVCSGLANKEVAARLFVSTRTVQTHLSRVYAKVGVSSRVPLAHEAQLAGFAEHSGSYCERG